MCCGQKRLEMRNSLAQGTTKTVPRYESSNRMAWSVQSGRSASPATRRVFPTTPVNTPTPGIQPRIPAPNSVVPASIFVRYVEKSPISVRGAVSGIYYQFSDSRPVHSVDARDASILLGTHLFRRA